MTTISVGVAAAFAMSSALDRLDPSYFHVYLILGAGTIGSLWTALSIFIAKRDFGESYSTWLWAPLDESEGTQVGGLEKGLRTRDRDEQEAVLSMVAYDVNEPYLDRIKAAAYVASLRRDGADYRRVVEAMGSPWNLTMSTILPQVLDPVPRRSIQAVNRAVMAAVSDSMRPRVRSSGPPDLVGKQVLLAEEASEHLSRGYPVAIVGQSGLGKTRAAQAAAHLWQNMNPSARVLWMEMQDYHSLDTFRAELWRLASEVLDHPSLLAMPSAEQRRLLGRLSKDGQLLLVIDGLSEDLHWNYAVTTLAPAGAEFPFLLTSAKASPLLVGMKVLEASPLDFEATRQLLAGQEFLLSNDQMAEVFSLSRGNCQAALVFAAQLSRHDGLPFLDRLTLLGSASGTALVDHLYGSVVESLSTSARRVLFAVAMWPSVPALEDLSKHLGLSVQQLREHLLSLVDASLLEMRHQTARVENGGLVVHSLLRSYLERQTDWKDVQDDWIEYVAASVSSVGKSWDEPEKLALLDGLAFRQAVERALIVGIESGRWDCVARIARGSRYYFYVRGLTRDYKWVYEAWIDAASHLDDQDELAEALLYLANVLVKLGEVQAAAPLIARCSVAGKQTDRSDYYERELWHIEALSALSSRKLADVNRAIDLWKGCLDRTEPLVEPERFNTFMRWLGQAHLVIQNHELAETYWAAAADHASQVGSVRATLWVLVARSEMLLRMGDLQRAFAVSNAGVGMDWGLDRTLNAKFRCIYALSGSPKFQPDSALSEELIKLDLGEWFGEVSSAAGSTP